VEQSLKVIERSKTSEEANLEPLLDRPNKDSSSSSSGGAEMSADKAAAAGGAVVNKNFEMQMAIAAYCFCSATLLVINKVAVTSVPSSSFVLIAQFAASVVAVQGFNAFGFISDVEGLNIPKIRLFCGISLLFCACLWTNVKALEFCNVETVIVFRSMSPIAVAIADWAFLGQALPSGRSWLALLTIVLGAVLYVVTDEGFDVDNYMWVFLYFFSIVAEMVYVKYVVESVEMTTWSRVYYNNVLSIPPTLALGFFFGEFDFLSSGNFVWTIPSVGALLMSCVVGVGISYAGFNLRKQVTATYFTMIGVMCKIASVLLNIFIWDKHANATGIAALVICILAGTFYQQTKKR